MPPSVYDRRRNLLRAVRMFLAASLGPQSGSLTEVATLHVAVSRIHLILTEAFFVRFHALVRGRHLARASGFRLGTQGFPRGTGFPGPFRHHFRILSLVASDVRGCRPALGRSAAGLAAFAPSLSSQFAILGKAASFRRDAFASLAPGLCCKAWILRETSFLGGYALAAFARDSALLRLIHRSKAAIGRAFMLVIPRHDVSFLDKVFAGDVTAYRYRLDNGPSGGTVPAPYSFFQRRRGRESNFASKICRKTRRL